jgi:hypothetical protein
VKNRFQAFAFRCILRRYAAGQQVQGVGQQVQGIGQGAIGVPQGVVVGLYTLNPVDPVARKRLVSTLEPIKRETGFKVCLFTFNLCRYSVGMQQGGIGMQQQQPRAGTGILQQQQHPLTGMPLQQQQPTQQPLQMQWGK